ncbi:MAG: hypothetical protein ACRDQU_14140 [Pseudonocardiaceae bacterium]
MDNPMDEIHTDLHDPRIPRRIRSAAGTDRGGTASTGDAVAGKEFV